MPEEDLHKRMEEVTEDRGKVYGDLLSTFAATGKALTALLEAHYEIKLPHDIPPHVAGQVMVIIKALRASKNYDYNEDSYIDEMNFARLSMQLDPRRPKQP